MNKTHSDPANDDLPAARSSGGLSIAGLLELPDDLRKLARWAMREVDVSVADAVQDLGLEPVEAERQLRELVKRSYLYVRLDEVDVRYQLASIHRRPRRAAADLLGKLG